MKKRLFSLVLAFALCMGLMVPVSAEETVSVVWLDEDLVPSGSLGFDDGMMGVRRNKGAYQYGFVDQTGKLVIPLQYSETQRFTEGLAPVSRARDSGWDLWGYIDRDGKQVIPCIYQLADNFSEGLAAVEILSEDDGYKYGYIDKTGKVVIPFEYDFGRSFIDGYAAVQKNGKWGFIDKSGEIVIPFEYGLTGLGFSNGLAEVYKNGKQGLINEKNEFVIPPELNYSDILYCSEWDMVQVRKGNWGDFDYGFIDKDGTFKIPLIYDACYGVSEGLSAARFGPICGFLDKNGEWAIPFLYSEVSPFFEGLAAVKQNGKAGYINKAGEVGPRYRRLYSGQIRPLYRAHEARQRHPNGELHERRFKPVKGKHKGKLQRKTRQPLILQGLTGFFVDFHTKLLPSAGFLPASFLSM